MIMINKNIKFSSDVKKNWNFYSWENFACDIIIISNITSPTLHSLHHHHRSTFKLTFCHSRGGSFIMINQQTIRQKNIRRETRVCRYAFYLFNMLNFFPQNHASYFKVYIFRETVRTFFWSQMDTFFVYAIGTCECHL